MWDDSYRPEQLFTRDILSELHPDWEISVEYVIKKLTLDGIPYRGCKPDIAVVKEKIIIRLNGGYHFASDLQMTKDDNQREALKQAGWTVIDFNHYKMVNLFKLNKSKSEKTIKLAKEEIIEQLGKMSLL